ncbi:MAG TPA: hypothetical protein VNF49_04050 [Candidatus Binataceae bacterium]|nr:hypothetical protein [Candidatus Binataceae bacterium]
MGWQYTKRPDNRIAVTLDNNVWNFLFDKKIDLAVELPCDEFTIFITREVEIETLAIPDKTSKAALKDYIASTIAGCKIKTTSVFGFATDGSGPQRVGGFDQGTWQSQTEREFYDAIRERYLIGRTETNSQLTKHEGDAAVAAQSFFSIALTCEKPNTPGPLRFAAKHGGKVLYLVSFDESRQTLREYIRALHAKACLGERRARLSIKPVRRHTAHPFPKSTRQHTARSAPCLLRQCRTPECSTLLRSTSSGNTMSR